MIVAGSKRHAKEIVQLFHQVNDSSNLFFFDDVSEFSDELFLGKHTILRSLEDVKKHFVLFSPNFVLGVGNPLFRFQLTEKLERIGGILTSIISNNALVGNYNVNLGHGLNIMNQVMISNDVQIGKGSLINAYSSIHHDAIIGDYCEVSPHSVLLGGCVLGDFVRVGANATILPDIKIGSRVTIGAVVTCDLPAGCVAVGVPARILNNRLV
jgi:sugar O-acyltransferase (sialic acid O-acetyltransferase NeuD family)